MTIEVSHPDPNGFLWLSGVTGGDDVRAPFGRFGRRVGAHFFGVDDESFLEPVVVRAYYDPDREQDARAKAVLGTALYVGYMQFVRILCAGRPVSPAAYGGALADRGPYAVADHRFVDFMGPAQARARVDDPGKKLDPFYAFNGAPGAGPIRSYEDFALWPRPGGPGNQRPYGVLRWSNPLAPNQARCASLVAPLAQGLLTGARLGGLLTEGNRLRTITETADTRVKAAFEVALDDMRDRKELVGLTDGDLTGRVVGPYVLISGPDPEDMAPSVCVHRAADGVVLHLLSHHDLRSAQEQAVTASVRRMSAAAGAAMEEVPPDHEGGGTEPDRVAVTGGRGRSALDPLPPGFGAGLVVERQYTTVLVAKTGRPSTRKGPAADLRVVNGFSWSARQSFDPVARTLTFDAVSEPQPLEPTNLAAPLDAYFAAVEHPPNESPTADVSSFDQAALRVRLLGDPEMRLDVVPRFGTADDPDTVRY